ncbi:MAG: hypothetical protein KGZ86_04255 [Candidatus Latescibacteria bacterium]|nr:hypothetical protein [Candidatus Latescibacterota bacterium]
MKYTITVNQSALAEYGLIYKTDWREWLIIDYLKDFVIYEHSKRIIYNNEEYIWLNYNHLMLSMPCLKLNSKSAVSVRIKKLERLGLIKTIQAPDNTLYYTFTDKMIDICFCRKKDIDRIKSRPHSQSYPHFSRPVRLTRTAPVRTGRTAQYNTNISIKNKDNNKDISFSSFLNTEEIKPQINTDEHRLEQEDNHESTKDRKHENPVKREVKGFKTLSGVWQVVENIRQRGLRKNPNKNDEIT